MSPSSSPSPTDDEKDEFLLSCRYGELDDVRLFVATYGAHAALAGVRDAHGNTPLHMVAGNGHEDVLTYLLSLLRAPSATPIPNPNPPPTAVAADDDDDDDDDDGDGDGDTRARARAPSLAHTVLRAQNTAGSTPLHWAALNAHLAVVQALVAHPSPSPAPSPDPGPDPAPAPGPDPGLGVDLLDVKNAAGLTPLGEAERAGWDAGARWMVGVMNLAPAAESAASASASASAGAGADDGDAAGEGEGVDAIEVEIEDADGGVAQMSLSAKQLLQTKDPIPARP